MIVTSIEVIVDVVVVSVVVVACAELALVLHCTKNIGASTHTSASSTTGPWSTALVLHWYTESSPAGVAVVVTSAST